MQDFKKEKNRNKLWKNIINEYSLKKNIKINMIEIGVWKGDFAKSMLANCEFINNYYLIDPWKNLDNWNKPYNVGNIEFDKIYKDTCKKLNVYKNKIHILRGKTHEVINQIDDNTIDIIYIDGDHTAKGITVDLIMSFPKLKNGGILGGDDYIENIYHHQSKYDPTMVKPVVDGFIIANNSKILETYTNHNQFLILKK